MGTRHWKDAEFWRENLDTLLEICKDCEDENVDDLKRLKRRAKSSNLNKKKSEKFEEEMHQIIQCIDNEPWKKFIKKINDDAYEEKRVRISVKSVTKTRLEKKKKQFKLHSIDEVIRKLLKLSEPSSKAKRRKK